MSVTGLKQKASVERALPESEACVMCSFSCVFQRRRSAEDELAMRGFLQEGDLISVEVQVVFLDGAVSLHKGSLKYGKLGQVVLVQVSPSLVEQQKTHFHDLPCGASVIHLYLPLQKVLRC